LGGSVQVGEGLLSDTNVWEHNAQFSPNCCLQYVNHDASR